MVDCWISTAIGVISGIMGIFDFLKNRYGELTAMDLVKAQSTFETVRIWKKNMNHDIDEIYNAINLLPERQAFYNSMDKMRSDFLEIYNNFKLFLDEDCPISRNDNRYEKTSASKASDCRIVASRIIGDYKTSGTPLLSIHNTVRDVLHNFTTMQASWIGNYQVRSRSFEK
ncbi:hypothetical protein QAD02_004609 [Eretmocerus hayati]|uniref:Uncharacterized protein n=1 Tax=Eretmocerus hayati TaxID=131215 RepID=A0ACC2NSY8_9HYME|nr:hypothetical protein QAD02_004609 [Eretmocerus hayati]